MFLLIIVFRYIRVIRDIRHTSYITDNSGSILKPLSLLASSIEIKQLKI